MKPIIVVFAVAFVGCASAQPVPTRPVTTQPESYEALPPPPPPPSVDGLDNNKIDVPKFESRCGKRYPTDRNEVWQTQQPCWKVHAFYMDMLYVHVALNLSAKSSEDLRRFFCNGELNTLQPPPMWVWSYDYLLEKVMLEDDPLAGVQSVKAELRMLGKAAYCGQNTDRRFADKLTRFVRKFGAVEDPGLIWKITP